MTREGIDKLVEKYFAKEWPWSEDRNSHVFPGGLEHRYDEDSSAICYSLIRHFKPKMCVEVGTWQGGSTHLILSALIKNNKAFYLVSAELSDDMRQKTEENVMRICGQLPTLVGAIQGNLDKVPEKIDFLFIDTDHDTETTQWIVENLFPRVKKGGLVAIHDWAVQEVAGVWVGKGFGGTGGLPETQYLMDLHKQGRLPLKKLFWTYEHSYQRTEFREGSFWLKV